MGINVTQKMIIGIELYKEDCYHITSEAIYQDQPRYNTKTGKISHLDRVLVKEQEDYFQFEDIVEKNEDFTYFIEKVAEKYNIESAIDEDKEIGYIGYKCGLNNGSYSYDLLEGTLSLDEINDTVTTLKEIFPDKEIGLHFVGYIG